jgi:hypothetical protein
MFCVKKTIKLIKVTALALTVAMLFSFTGCAAISSWFGELKGELVGREFTITTYDHYGNPTMVLSGTKVHVGVLTNDANFDTNGFESEVLEITINGHEMYQIGKTAIFAEDGLDMVTDFEIDSEINAEDGGGYMPFDRLVNDYANQIGKGKVVVISSQLGIPIGVYQGNSVYVEIPENLPKMTLLNIDGKALYISRATYEIFDAELIKSNS